MTATATAPRNRIVMNSTARSAFLPLAARPSLAALSLGVSLSLAAAFSLGPPARLAAQDGVALPVGTPAPDANVEDLEGRAVSLLEVAGVAEGNPALIEFWAAWCEQCEALQPQLDAIHERYRGRVGVVAVAVAVAQSPRRVRRHVERHAPGYAYVYDASGEAVRAYQALTTSIVVLVDGAGRVAYAGTGPDQDLTGAVEAMLEAGDPASSQPSSSGAGVTLSITAASSS